MHNIGDSLEREYEGMYVRIPQFFVNYYYDYVTGLHRLLILPSKRLHLKTLSLQLLSLSVCIYYAKITT